MACQPALAVVDGRAAQSPGFAFDFASGRKDGLARGVEHMRLAILEPGPGLCGDGAIADFQSGEPGAARLDPMAEMTGEILSVAHRSGLGERQTARRQQYVLCPDGEMRRCDDKAVLHWLQAGHGTVHAQRHVLVA